MRGAGLAAWIGGGTAAVLCVVGLAGCSRSSPSASSTTTTTAAPTTTTTVPPTTSTVAPATTTTAAPATTTTSRHPVSTTSTTSKPAAAVNLVATAAIKAQLLAAGAALNHVPVSQYSGLAPGLTYYAQDRVTGMYWAAARLVPAPTPPKSPPSQAQIASQDRGSYTVFSRTPGAAWKAYAAGNEGGATPCPVTIPAAVVKVWTWPPGSCRPPNI